MNFKPIIGKTYHLYEKKFLKQFPDHNELSSINCIEKKSVVSHLGLTLQKFDNYKTIPNNKIPIILWNHRWEYDKNPTSFFHALNEIKKDLRIA